MSKKIMSFKGYSIKRFRDFWVKNGHELINITSLCEPKLGNSGVWNDFNEPEENIFHIQLHYRDEIIANITNNGVEIIDDKKYICFSNEEGDFIIFRKVKNDERDKV